MDYEGQRLDGRYKVESLVGEGGMADVYRGVDLSASRVVAIKVLKEEYRDNNEVVRRFLNEGRAISVLDHPNIVKVYDISVTDKVYYIVMEYIDGITLKEYIEQRGEPLTYREAVHFTSQTLLALQHAHVKGIVHRDIKPQNIMIMEDGSIRVTDFGIARMARSEVHTDGDQAIGSVHYISPEQAQGAQTDQRADIYSLGIMMYEMLTGRLPFEDENAVAIAVKQISDSAPPITKVNPSVPKGIAEIAQKAINKNPTDRYNDALDMLRDIEEFKKNPSISFDYKYLDDDIQTKMMGKVMANKRVSTEKTTKKAKPPKKIRRKRIGFLVPIVLGFTIAIVSVCAVYGWDLLQNSGNPLFVEYENVELPDFTGMNISEVREILSKAPYNTLRVEEREEVNPGVPEGEIIAQNPTSNNENPLTIKSNQKLYLTISSGTPTKIVPDLVGMSRQDAIQALLAEGITPYAKAVNAPGTPAGTVIGTSPGAGTSILVDSGTVVTIEIASNFEEYQRTVPDLTGVADLAQVSEILAESGLYLGEVREEVSVLPAGSVIRQSPEPGVSMDVGGDVHVWVSLAPPPVVEVPQTTTPTPTPTPPVSSTPESTPDPGTGGGTTDPGTGGGTTDPGTGGGTTDPGTGGGTTDPGTGGGTTDPGTGGGTTDPGTGGGTTDPGTGGGTTP